MLAVVGVESKDRLRTEQAAAALSPQQDLREWLALHRGRDSFLAISQLLLWAACVCPLLPPSHTEAPTPDAMVFGGGASGR